jgi:hypothetical protein
MDDKFKEELLSRKHEPFTDWQPAKEQSDVTQGLKNLLNDTVDQAHKTKEALEKKLEPFTEEAGAKIKEFATLIEDVASKSSKEARSFIAKTLETVAQKIKP